MTQASVHTQAPASRTAPSLAKSILGPPPKAEPSGDTQAAREVAAALIDRWYNDPVLFAWEACGVVLWRGQRDICAAVTAKWPCRVAVKSGHKTGKSLCLACIALWWWITRKNARVVMTAPTARQIRSTLWREVRNLWQRASKRLAILGGAGGRLYDLPEHGLKTIDSFDQSEIVGFSSKQPENVAGTSGENNLYLIDEASGVARNVFEAIDGNRAGGASVLLFSNPTKTSGEFFDAFNTKAHLYTRIHITSESTPNVLAGRRVVPGLATRQWVREKREEYGPDYENDPRYRVRVLGEFPLGGTNKVIPAVELETAKQRWFDFAGMVLGKEDLARNPDRRMELFRDPKAIARVRERWEEKVATNGPLVIGVDPSWGQGDLSVCYPRRGLRMFAPASFAGDGDNAGQAVATMVLEMARRLRIGNERAVVFIDCIGIGASATDHLKMFPEEVRLVAVNSGKAPVGHGAENEYLNLRAQMHFAGRRWLRKGGSFEPHALTEGDLRETEYSLKDTGEIVVEKKSLVRARLDRSPDHGDAFLLSTSDFLLALPPSMRSTRKVKEPLRAVELEDGY